LRVDKVPQASKLVLGPQQSFTSSFLRLDAKDSARLRYVSVFRASSSQEIEEDPLSTPTLNQGVIHMAYLAEKHVLHYVSSHFGACSALQDVVPASKNMVEAL
jgi:hypothetical protein